MPPDEMGRGGFSASFDPRLDIFVGDFAGPWRGRGRARRGKLRESILALLLERPRNGYQIMAELSERTLGAWQPSPGAVYPSLTQLTEEGLIEAVDLDGQKAYQLTDTGREAAGAVSPEPWAGEEQREQPDRPGRELRAVYDELRGLAKALKLIAAEATAEQLEAIAADIAALKRKLFATLAEPPSEPTE
jgi:DNA-binding PadR family transcriptional regulator